jgi:hypothetical protein
VLTKAKESKRIASLDLERVISIVELKERVAEDRLWGRKSEKKFWPFIL